MNNLKFIGRVVSNKFYLLLIVFLILISFGFYWYEYRPSQVRKECLREINVVNSVSCLQRMTDGCDQALKACLLKMGVN